MSANYRCVYCKEYFKSLKRLLYHDRFICRLKQIVKDKWEAEIRISKSAC